MWRILGLCLFSPLFAWQEDDIAETMMVYAPEDFRYRNDGLVPKLVYGPSFFQRFGPVTAGDILSRIPGMAGTADAGEFDRPQMRGISPAYTQVLVNGEPIPGGANDRTVVLDRIPAQLVKRVEVLRAPSAEHDAQGIAGTINIVLHDTAATNGLDLQMGLTHFDTDRADHGDGAFSWRRAGDWGSWRISGSVVDRHNPKRQRTEFQRFEDEDSPDDGAEKKLKTFRNLLKDEVNTLDSTEAALNAHFRTSLGAGTILEGGGMYLDTDRQERENADFISGGEVEESIFDRGDFQQETWGLKLRLVKNWGNHILKLDGAHHGMRLDRAAEIGVIEDGMAVAEERELNLTTDSETRLSASLSLASRGGHQVMVGVSLSNRDRDAAERLFEINDEGVWEQQEIAGEFQVKERRYDLFLADTWTLNDAASLQMGLRYEHTDLRLSTEGKDGGELFPSLHFLQKFGDYHRLRISLARTTRRPDFQDLQPFARRNQPYDGQITFGNSQLRAEFAKGLDLGYELRLKQQEGILGVNLFYREITDLVETLQTGPDRFQIQNAGDGKVWGLELDLGIPLDGLNLPGVSVYTNYSWQDSEVLDPQSGLYRRFNLQPDYVINMTLLHTLPKSGFSYGVNWVTQGKASEILLTETSIIDAGGLLDVYLEKRWHHWSLRLSAANLTDGKRTVVVNEYDNLWTEGNPIETGMETEQAGRRFRLEFRGRF